MSTMPMERISTAAVAEARRVLEQQPMGERPVFACRHCEDTGMVFEQVRGEGGRLLVQQARRCECSKASAARKRLERAGIPRRYAEATLTGFRTAGADHSIAMAHGFARGIVQGFPVLQGRPGLLLTGTCGVGKTHLAAAALRELVLERGAAGRFWDCSDLLVQIRRSYSTGESVPTEGMLLEELARVDVLVLDDLGRQRVTDWSFDLLSTMLGARYNSHRLTIVTSNFANLPPGAGQRGAETLGDRIGAPTHSRLQEMCRPIEMVGQDFRTRRQG